MKGWSILATKETAGTRLLNLIQHLPEWSSTLGDIQIRILSEGIASIYRRMIDGLQLDESLMGHFPPINVVSQLPEPALLQLARMAKVCENAPASFLEDHEADSLFESLISQFTQIRSRIELELGVSAWRFYVRFHELEVLSRSMESTQILETVRLIMAIYLKVVSTLKPDEAKLEDVPVPEGWFVMVSGETRKMAARLVVFCLEPEEYLNWQPPRGMHEERFRLETQRLTDFLVRVRTMAQ